MNQRLKGHTFERRIAKFFREALDYTRGKTTRSCSRMLDACGVDIVGVPWLVQCKSGYARARPKFEEEYEYIRTQLSANFGAEHDVMNYPIILIHELDVGAGNKRLPHHTYVSMTLEDFAKTQAPNQRILDII